MRKIDGQVSQRERIDMQQFLGTKIRTQEIPRINYQRVSSSMNKISFKRRKINAPVLPGARTRISTQQVPRTKYST